MNAHRSKLNETRDVSNQQGRNASVPVEQNRDSWNCSDFDLKIKATAVSHPERRFKRSSVNINTKNISFCMSDSTNGGLLLSIFQHIATPDNSNHCYRLEQALQKLTLSSNMKDNITFIHQTKQTDGK